VEALVNGDQAGRNAVISNVDVELLAVPLDRISNRTHQLHALHEGGCPKERQRTIGRRPPVFETLRLQELANGDRVGGPSSHFSHRSFAPSRWQAQGYRWDPATAC